MPSWGTASLLEIAWTLAALIGVGATLIGLWQAWLDAWDLLDWPEEPHPTWHRHPGSWVATFRAVWRHRPRKLWRLGWIFVRYETALFFVELAFALAGIRAMRAPPPDTTIPLDWGAVLIGLMFLAAGVLGMSVSVKNRLDRRANDKERKRA